MIVKETDLLATFISIAAICLIAGFFLGGCLSESYWKDRSIKAGVAEYILTNPATGATEFRYKEIK